MLDQDAICVLAIGDVGIWSGMGRPVHDELRFATLHDLDASMLDALQPAMIVSPLVGVNFDCLDVAHLLSQCDYRGAYRAVTQHLPHPKVVCREVQSLYPTIDFDIILTGFDRRRLV